jgi:V/A-type H+-transporting ATPase subunit D
MPTVTPTRSALLELREERRGMVEGYRFLDETRLVLAAELLQELGRYERLSAELEAVSAGVHRLLEHALARHGLDGLNAYPALQPTGSVLASEHRSVLGVLAESVTLAYPVDAPPAVLASPEAEVCRRAFAGLVPLAASVAAARGNVERLSQAYLRTARRARALEDVLLPEIDHTLAELDEALEDMDREEAVRVRHRPTTPPPTSDHQPSR